MNQTRQIILRAAEHIERNPTDFYFYGGYIPVPGECDTQTCALGWIGYFAGLRCGSWNIIAVAHEVLGLDAEDGDREFYDRMEEFAPSRNPRKWGAWSTNAAACARALRAYADMYHPALPSPAVEAMA